MRSPVILSTPSCSASGLAAVWANENTREAIVAAFKRKEVYASTGPRIQVRFFGGWKFKAGDARAKDLAARGYKKGVPMGGDLGEAPRARGSLPMLLTCTTFTKSDREANNERNAITAAGYATPARSRRRLPLGS